MEVRTYGNVDSDIVIIQMSGAHEKNHIEKEVLLIKELTDRDFLLLTCFVDDWNRDLSPWKEDAVFGNEAFAGGADKTFESLKNDVIDKYSDRTMIIGGYSLAGLFALWAAYQTDAFSGVAAASPSVWFPDFLSYAIDNAVKTDTLYLSLGDKEEKTKNKIMRTVGDNIKALHDHYEETGIKTTLEWNEGNHFKEPELRTAKAIAWVINNLDEQICRIKKNERLMLKAKDLISDHSADNANGLSDIMSKLDSYYKSDEWKKDFEDDEAGRLPSGLKRGVLSEDGLFDLFEEYNELNK